MNQIDAKKIEIILYDAMQRMTFLKFVDIQDYISSDLAGHEITKLLAQQRKQENNYANLVQQRTQLTGISNRHALFDTQNNIRDVSQNLKESTNKLCRLFKGNSEITRDNAKVQEHRNDFIFQMETLIGNIQQQQMQKYHQITTQQLQQQDKLRNLIAKDKQLNQELKRLQTERIYEAKEFELEKQQKQAQISQKRELLVYKKERAELKKEYSEKEARSFLNTTQRQYDNQIDKLTNDLKEIKNKIDVETKVHAQLKSFLVTKEINLKEHADSWNNKKEKMEQQMEELNQKLDEKKQKDFKELESFRNRAQEEESTKILQEQLELKGRQEQKEEEVRQIRLANAIKLIQFEYKGWQLGGGKKKKKKKGKKKK